MIVKKVGHISARELRELRARGLTPKQAVDAIMTEAQSRHPEATILIERGTSAGTFDVILVD